MEPTFVILHVARIQNEPGSGVQVIVPEHIRAQQPYAAAALLNLAQDPVRGGQAFDYTARFPDDLPPPFCRPDIVIFHEVYRLAYPAIARTLRKRSIPYVVVPHGSRTAAAQTLRAWKKRPANWLMFNRFVRNAAAIQCLSQKEFDETRDERKFIGTNGMRIPDRRKTQFSDTVRTIVYIGRLDRYYKGLDLLMDAVAKCQAFLRAHHCRIDLYGPDSGGSARELARRIHALGVADVVTLNGAAFDAAKTEILLRADCFIQTSRSEGMPVGLLEAMSCGLPCIVTDGTGLAEYVAAYDAGWCCRTDADAIAAAILTAVREGRLPEKSRNAVRLVRENFDWDAAARAAVQKYKEIASAVHLPKAGG